MARDGGNRSRGLDGRVPPEMEAELGILAVYTEQHPLDCLGLSTTMLMR